MIAGVQVFIQQSSWRPVWKGMWSLDREDNPLCSLEQKEGQKEVITLIIFWCDLPSWEVINEDPHREYGFVFKLATVCVPLQGTWPLGFCEKWAWSKKSGLFC